MNPFDTFLINPILNALIFFYTILSTIGLPWALGFAIILLTIIIRLALWPLTATQLKSTQKMAALKPHLDRIKDEHGHDKMRHQQEVSKLYKEHGVNPLAGCLPLLLQIPVFISLYQVLLKVVDLKNTDFLTNINDRLYYQFLHLDKVPNTNFIGFHLESKPNQWSEVGILILLIPIITGILQYIQSKMLTVQNPKTQAVVKKKNDSDKKSEMEDTMASMQSQMTLIMPLMIAFFSYGFPVGLSLYWNTFTVIGIIQQYKISGPGPFAKFLPDKWRKNAK
ncbi:hypothetical protein A2164_00830 [Candidatus Curtissbacteria bacterium RBG_13_35_7]|uniref:Membrane insertase YidC/Oxa/ALB C-terminal domain-containing protein n=1 Tax=Candidatus Curtissbacteria bacterium RBG_13_35_7 TaxID=1797705 RepID=A0A1F5G128_9BACT|nr:MAG: hypothetical protein A2164_00830 [Candidatus Curtissbacteria bacterium RBG_13_35_7]